MVHSEFFKGLIFIGRSKWELSFTFIPNFTNIKGVIFILKKRKKVPDRRRMSRVGFLDCNSERRPVRRRESPGLAVRRCGFESCAGGLQADFPAEAAS